MFGASRSRMRRRIIGHRDTVKINNNFFNSSSVSYKNYMKLYQEAMRMQRVAINKQEEREYFRGLLSKQLDREKESVKILEDADIDPEIVRKIKLTLAGK